MNTTASTAFEGGPGPSAPDTSSTCPLCGGRCGTGVAVYDVAVCRRCRERFAERRYFAFVVDLALLAAVFGLTESILLRLAYPTTGGLPPPLAMRPLWLSIALATAAVLWSGMFAARDGFGGASLGKRLARLRVVEKRTLHPIGFTASVKRHLPAALFACWAIVVKGSLPSLLAPLAAVFQLALLAYLAWVGERLKHGPRPGDGWADSRVVWMPFAHRSPFDTSGSYCARCGYDLRGNVSGACPECSTSIQSSHDASPPGCLI